MQSSSTVSKAGEKPEARNPGVSFTVPGKAEPKPSERKTATTVQGREACLYFISGIWSDIKFSTRPINDRICKRIFFLIIDQGYILCKILAAGEKELRFRGKN